MTVTSGHVNEVHFGNPKPNSIEKTFDKGYNQFEQLNYSAKTERFLRQ